MNRRKLLAFIGAGSSVGIAGCLGDAETPDSQDGNEPTREAVSTTQTESNEEVTLPQPTGECGPAAMPQSARFVDEGGDSSYCYEGAEASLAIENERDETLPVGVKIVTAQETVFEVSYTLSPNERIIERSVLTAHETHTASVTVDGEDAVTGEWGDVSCFRHGISLTPEAVEFGLIPPLSGPGDTQHDCYAGDSAQIAVSTDDVPQTVTVSIVDHCKETVDEETVTLAPNRFERIHDLLLNGGIYDVVVAVDGGHAAIYNFQEECWGVSAQIDEEGKVTVHQIRTR